MTASTYPCPPLNIRIRASQRHIIEQAAEACEQTISDFVREAALHSANKILLDRRTFHVDEETWKSFTSALDAPPQENGRLRDLMTRKPAWT